MSSKEEDGKLATSATTEDEDDGEENDTSLSGGLQGWMEVEALLSEGVQKIGLW